MNRKILVPVDFSECSHNAALTAAQLARDIHAELVLFHSVYVTIPDPLVPAYYIGEMTDEAHSKSRQAMEALSRELKGSFQVNVAEVMTDGEPESEIIRYAAENGISAVVMGTKGAHHAIDRILGTTTAAMVGRLSCPLMVVPMEARYAPWLKVGIATAFTGDEPAIAERFLDTFRAEKSEITFFHVKTPSEKQSYMHHFELQKYVDQNLNMKLIEQSGLDIVEGLEKFVADAAVNVLVVQAMHRNFIEGLFHRSVSKRLAETIGLPVVIYS